MISRDDLKWEGDRLYFRNRFMASIERDSKYPNMWRVRLPDGGLPDMANISWARDAARALALAQLNIRDAA
jgi:hypothetical protein